MKLNTSYTGDENEAELVIIILFFMLNLHAEITKQHSEKICECTCINLIAASKLGCNFYRFNVVSGKNTSHTSH
ncbi:hypothetical protein Tsp_10295 [Trichinella spiralis]|uniref:hypothetical protein n=1 Tax=Trichinella spiralis TaxID=6334 RepID=UPI0001EFE1C7|nr:hypothetical protein Tsp_10295 [Trichinella spiralis]